MIGAIDCWYVFSEHDKVTPDDWAPRAREALGERYSGVALGGGTDLYFAELNREPPDPSMFDVLNFSMNPQVHAFDTPHAHPERHDPVRRRRQRTPTYPSDAGVGLTNFAAPPVQTRMPPKPDLDVSNTPLPSDVDARQMTYVAAHWTAMSIKYLAQAGSIAHAHVLRSHWVEGNHRKCRWFIGSGELSLHSRSAVPGVGCVRRPCRDDPSTHRPILCTRGGGRTDRGRRPSHGASARRQLERRTPHGSHRRQPTDNDSADRDGDPRSPTHQLKGPR